MAELWYWIKIGLMVGMFVIALGCFSLFASVMMQYRQEERDEE